MRTIRCTGLIHWLICSWNVTKLIWGSWMQSTKPEKRKVISHQDEGWSLPIVWIIILILIVLHLVFGWVVWPIAVGLFLAISLGVTIYNATISRKREQPPE